MRRKTDLSGSENKNHYSCIHILFLLFTRNRTSDHHRVLLLLCALCLLGPGTTWARPTHICGYYMPSSCPVPAVPSKPTAPAISYTGTYTVSSSTPPDQYGSWIEVTGGDSPLSVSNKSTGQYSYSARHCLYTGQSNLCSAWSAATMVTVDRTPGNPTINNPSMNACGPSLSVSWSPASSKYPSGASKRYDLQEQVGSGSWYNVEPSYSPTDRTNTTATSYSRNPQPTELQSYRYRVRAYYVWNGYTSDKTGYIYTTGQSMPQCPPTAVGNLTATQLNPESSNTSVNVTWSPASVAVGAILSYQVQRRVSGGSWPSENGPYDCEASGITSCLYPSVSRGTTYEYRVRAHKSTVDGPWSSVTGSVVYATPSTPNRPGISVTLQNDEATQYTVSWNAVENGDTGTISYRLWESSTGAWLNMNGATSKTYSSWATATTYQYKVKACNPNNVCSGESQTNSINIPGQPGVITIDDIGNNGRNYTLNWTPASGTADSYQLRRSGDGGAIWTTVGNQDGELLSEAISNATQGASYQYKVRACNSTACGQYNNVRGYWVPSTPSGITFNVSAAVPSLTVNWASLPATGYEIQQSTNGGTNWDAAVTVTSNSYTPASVNNGVDYTYRLRACNSDNACSGYTGNATKRVPYATPGIPVQPTVTVNSAGGTLSVNWNTVSGAVSSYNLEQSSDGGSTWNSVQNTSAQSYAPSGLAGGITYRYRVSACNADGCSVPSTVAIAYLPHAAPAVPNLISTGGLLDVNVYGAGWTGEYTVSWFSAGGTVDTIAVMETEPGGTPQAVTPDAGTTDQRSYNKPPNYSGDTQEYRYAARACNADNCSAWKEIVVQINAYLLPGIPTNFQISAGPTPAGEYTLRWSRPSGTSELHYYYLDNVDTTENPDYPAIPHDNGQAYFEQSISGGQSGQTYRYRVRACFNDDNGCDTYTAPLAVYIPYAAPGQPGAISHTNLDPATGAYILNWSGAGGQVTSYELQESTDNGASWSDKETLATTSRAFTGQTNGWTYAYRVRACNVDACGDYTALHPVYIPHINPGVPTGLAVSELDAVEQRLTLTWTAPAGHVDTYQVQHSTNAGSNWDAGVDIASARYTAIDLGNGVHHSYRVRACNADECSAYTALVTAYLPFAAPGVPGALNHQETENNPASGAFTVHWTAPAAIDSAGAPLTLYQLEYSTNSGGIWQAAPTGGAIAGQINVSNSIAGAPINATLSGLITGAAYSVRARSCNADACSGYTAAYQVYLQRPAPGAPGIVTTTPSSEDHLARRFTVQWTAPASGGVNHYQLEVYGGETQGLENWLTVAGKTQATSYTFTDRSYGETYRYRVRACGESESSVATCSVWVETDDIRLKYPTPNAPSGISVFDLDQTNGSYTLEWNGVLGWAPQYRYELEQSTNGGASWLVLAETLDPDHEVSISGRTPGAYRYRVRACNPDPDNDCGPWSPAAEAIILPSPSAPASLNIDDLDGQSCQFNVDWTPPVDGQGTYHYELTVSIDGAAPVELAWTTGASHTLFVNGSDSGKPHTFRVRARTFSNGQYSPWGTWRSITDTTSCGYSNSDGTLRVSSPKYSENGQYTVSMSYTATNPPPGLQFRYEVEVDFGGWSALGGSSVTYGASNARTTGLYNYRMWMCDHDIGYMDGDPISCSSPSGWDQYLQTWTTVLRKPGQVGPVTAAGLPDPVESTYQVTDSRFTLNWNTPPGNPGSSTYTYEIQSKPVEAGSHDWTMVAEQTATSRLIDLPEFGVAYDFRVRACAHLSNYVNCGNWSELDYPVKQSIGVPRFAVNTYPADGELVIYDRRVPVQWLPPWDMAEGGIDHYEISIRSKYVDDDGFVHWVGPNVLATAEPIIGQNANPPVQQAMVEIDQGGQKEFLIRACGASSSASCGAALTFQITVVIPPDAPEKPSGLYAQTDPDMLGSPFNGVLTGDFSVQASGAASYELPIVVPPGTAGVQPKLSLAYSSHIGNAIAGWGWTVGGMSTISRCNKTKVQDGEFKAVDYTTNDAYCLDGQHLVEVTSGEYRTELNNFRRISLKQGGDCGLWFEVKTQAGETLEYGKSTDSCVALNGTGAVRTWGMNRVTDAMGNYMDFRYTKDNANNEFVLQSVDYTGRVSGSAPYESVEFEYESRPDPISFYQGGRKIKQDQRLKRIVTSAGTYTLAYLGTNDYDWISRLHEITYCAVNPENGIRNQCMEPLQFNWSEANASWKLLPEDNFAPYGFVDSEGTDRGAQLVDMDNDGLVDLVYNTPRVTYRNVGTHWTRWSAFDSPVELLKPDGTDAGVRFADIDGDGRPDLLTSNLSPYGRYELYKNTETGWSGPSSLLPERFVLNNGRDSGLRIADLNSDGLNDLIVGNSAGNTTWINTGGNWSIWGQYQTDFDFVDSNNISTGAQLLDINGDGLVDIVGKSYWDNATQQTMGTLLNTGDGWERSYTYAIGASIVVDGKDQGVRITDINGDGLPDLLSGRPNLRFSNLNTGKGFESSDQYESPVFVDNDGKSTGVVLMDLNDDGRNDVVLPNGSLLSDESDWRSSNAHLPVHLTGYQGRDTGVRMADINGDGRLDILLARHADSGLVSQAWTKVSEQRRVTSIVDGLGNTTGIKYKSLADKTLDGRQLPIYTATAQVLDNPGQLEIVLPTPVVDRVTVPDGISGELTTEYAYKGLTAASSGRGLQGFEEFIVISPDNRVDITRYAKKFPYTGLTLVAESRFGLGGPLLSRKVTEYCYVKDEVETVGFSSIDPDATCPAYNDLAHANESLFVYSKKISTETHYLNNSATSSQASVTEVARNTYGAFGYMLTTSVTTSGDGHVYQSVTTNTYDPNPDWNWLGRLMSSVVINSTDGITDDNSTRRSEFEYYGDTGLLWKEKLEPGAGVPVELHTAKEYDQYGNTIITTVCASDFSDCDAGAVNSNAGNAGSEAFRTTSSAFDSLGRYPVTVSNSLGHDETHEYNHRLGLQTRLEGPNGLVTTWKYDGHGRKLEETNQLSGTTRWNYYRVNSGFVPNALYAVETIAPTGAKGRIYYDALRRERRSLTQNLFGEYIASDVEYDRFGQTLRSTSPYFYYGTTAGDAHWTIYHYDDIGRTTQVDVPIGDIDGDNADDGLAVSTSDYQGFTISTTDANGRRKSERKNALGQTTRIVEDVNGLNIPVDYAYDSQGKLTTTTVDNNPATIITIHYDIRGNKLWMADPDMGRWDYQYNGFGELVWQRDAKQQVTEIDYDVLGRMVERREFGDQNSVSTWTYDTANGASVGKLHIETGPAGSSKTYSYDTLGRLINTEYNVGMSGRMATFNVSQSYDQFSRIKHITYPQVGSKRLTIENVYSPYGGLWYVLDTGDSFTDQNDDTVYWIAELVDERGQVMQELLRNQNSINNSYNHATGWLQKVESWDVNTDMIQQTRYEFDRFGNVMTRNRFKPWIVNPDGTFYAGANEEIEERFTYDSLDRLTGSDVTRDGAPTDSKVYDYDRLGNFVYKDDINNTYSYNSCNAGPHAVCEADGTSFEYDANGNLVASTGAKVRDITYSAFNKPVQLTENGATVNFYYGADRSRMFKTAMVNGNTELTYYIGLGANGNALYQQKAVVDTNGDVIKREHQHFIYAGGYHSSQAFAVRLVEEFEDNDASQPNFIQYRGTEYFHRDHLGSVIAITDEMGTINDATGATRATLLSFDAWGKRRNPDWSDSSGPGSVNQYTGTKTNLMYTGHESIPEVGLIHMNGRVYDPELGRFLSADPNIQEARSGQNYNRYSYVLNNPIKYSDPSGFFFKKLYKHFLKVSGVWATHKWLADKPVLVGIIQAVLSYVGNVIWFVKFIAAAFAANHVYVNGGSSHDALKAGAASLVSSYGGAYAKTLSGVQKFVVTVVVAGTVSELSGGKFANGARSAAYMYLAQSMMDAMSESGSGSGGGSDAEGTTATGDAAAGGVSCNPINIATGEKYLTITDYKSAGAGQLTLTRHYSSYDKRASALGRGWRHNFNRQLVFDKRYGKIASITAIRHAGESLGFEKATDTGEAGQTNTWLNKRQDRFEELQQTEQGWLLKLADDTREYYDQDGKLLKIVQPGGYEQALSYNKQGRLNKVEDTFGQALQFRYNYKGWLSRVIFNDGSVVRYIHNNRHNLVKAVAADKTYHRYHYNDPRYQFAITGITDEQGQRIHSMAYDYNGRAVLSALGGDAERTDIRFMPDRVATVTSSLGKQTTYTFDENNRPLNVEGHPTLTCYGTNQNYEYNIRGLLVRKVDWSGVATVYEYNDRGLETLRIEAKGTTDERRMQTTWHPEFRLPVKVVNSGLTTFYRYNDKGLLVGKLERDTLSSRPISDTIKGIYPERSWSFAYNEQGLLTSVDGPRADVDDVTRFVYDEQGNRTGIINALGHTSEVLAFNDRGLPLLVKDENGVETELSYNNRGWLVESRRKGPAKDEITRISYTGAGNYDGDGLVESITAPNGSSIYYHYDAGRRLVSEQNDSGEHIDYTLDLEGNRIAVTTYSDTGEVVQQQRRVYDELSRLLKVIGSDGVTLAMAYDKAGNRSTVTDGLNNKTAYAYDALNRLVASTDAADGVIRQDWDQSDRLVSVADQRGLVTEYVYNGFGQKVLQRSPDTGETQYRYDPAGNLMQKTDARQETTLYQYDAMNRLVEKSYPSAPQQNIRYAYDGNNIDASQYSIGKLTEVQDESGSSRYQYNYRGQIAQFNYQVEDQSYAQAYRYDSTGQLAAIQYPSGLWVTYAHNELGQINEVVARIDGYDAQQQVVAGDIRYAPMGPVQSLRYGNNLVLNVERDLDYRIRNIRLNHSASAANDAVYDVSYVYNPSSDITGILDNVEHTRSKTFAYDVLHRLVEAQSDYGRVEYDYDSVGNRLQRRHSMPESGASRATVNTVVEDYDYADDSNRLLSVAKTESSQSVLRELGYDAVGNITRDSRNDEVRLLNYAASNRLQEVEISRADQPAAAGYIYNAKGQRVIKRLGDQEIHYHYDVFNNLIAETNHNGEPVREYLYGAGQRLAVVDYTGNRPQLVYVLNDHLGTPQLMVNQKQEIVWIANVMPFGEEVASTSDAGIHQPLRFPGQYADLETGYSYNYYRDYDPSLGRYIQSDPIGLLGGVNTFGYALARPILYSDPLGLDGVFQLGSISQLSAGTGTSIELGGYIGWAGNQVKYGIYTTNTLVGGTNFGGDTGLRSGFGRFDPDGLAGWSSTTDVTLDGNMLGIPADVTGGFEITSDGNFVYNLDFTVSMDGSMTGVVGVQSGLSYTRLYSTKEILQNGIPGSENWEMSPVNKSLSGACF